MPENRIERTTVANRAEAARTATITHQPAEGGWAPAPWVPLVAAVAGGAMTAIGALLVAGTVVAGPVATLVGTGLVGAGTALAAYFGVKSAGPRSGGQ